VKNEMMMTTQSPMTKRYAFIKTPFQQFTKTIQTRKSLTIKKMHDPPVGGPPTGIKATGQFAD
jgi:hypothetical protein